MAKLDTNNKQKYEQVATCEREKIKTDKDQPKPYGYGIRHIQVILIFTSLTSIYIARAQINVTIVAMTDVDVPEITINETVLNNTREFNNDTEKPDDGLEFICVNGTFMFRENENDTSYDIYGSQNITCSEVNEVIKDVDLNETVIFYEAGSSWSVFTVYPWPKSTQELVLGAFFLGYLIMTAPMGVVCQRWGGKLPLQISLFNSGVITFITPWLAVWGNYKAVCIARVMIGLSQAGTYPSLHTLIAKWVPPCERGRLGTYVYTGSMVGSVVAFYMSGFLSASILGWPSVFWFTGILCMIIFILVTFIIAPSPQVHRSISEDEKKFILGQNHNKIVERNPTPWKAIFTSKPVAAAFVTHFGNSFLFLFLFTQMPTYLHFIIGVNIKNSGLLSSLPYFANFITSIILGNLADYFVNRGMMTTKSVRIASNAFANVIPAICLFCVSFTTNSLLAVILLVVCMGALSGSHTGWMVNYIDLAPNYSGALMASGNTLMNIGALILPALVSNIVTDVRNVNQWRILLFLVATIAVITNTVFMFFMSADVQPWNDGVCKITAELEDVEAKGKEEQIELPQ